MKFENILQENHRIYVDNCVLGEILDSYENWDKIPKLVVTPEVKKERLASKILTEEQRKRSEALREQTIHDLAYASSDRSGTYETANQLFKTLSLDMMRKDLNNEVHKQINQLDSKNSSLEYAGNLASYLLRLGAAGIGLIGLTYTKKLPFDPLDVARKNYDQKLEKLKGQIDPNELLSSATKKRKQWVRKNLERIIQGVGERTPNYDPLKEYNYTDLDLVTLASLDSSNGTIAGIYTRDADHKKPFELMQKLFGEGKPNLNLYLDRGENIEKKSIYVPSQDQIRNHSAKYLVTELKKENESFRDILSKVKKYQEINPRRELFLGGMNGLVGATSAIAFGNVANKAYEIYASGKTEEAIKCFGKVFSSGDFDQIRGGLALASLLVMLPSITYRTSKSAYNHIRKGLQYPKVD